MVKVHRWHGSEIPLNSYQRKDPVFAVILMEGVSLWSSRHTLTLFLHVESNLTKQAFILKGGFIHPQRSKCKPSTSRFFLRKNKHFLYLEESFFFDGNDVSLSFLPNLGKKFQRNSLLSSFYLSVSSQQGVFSAAVLPLPLSHFQ